MKEIRPAKFWKSANENKRGKTDYKEHIENVFSLALYAFILL